MKAEKLKVKAVVVTVPKKNVTPIVRCLERIGVKCCRCYYWSIGRLL